MWKFYPRIPHFWTLKKTLSQVGRPQWNAVFLNLTSQINFTLYLCLTYNAKLMNIDKAAAAAAKNAFLSWWRSIFRICWSRRTCYNWRGQWGQLMAQTDTASLAYLGSKRWRLFLYFLGISGLYFLHFCVLFRELSFVIKLIRIAQLMTCAIFCICICFCCR